MLMPRRTPFLILIFLSHTSFSQIPKWTGLKLFAGYSFDNGVGITVDKKIITISPVIYLMHKMLELIH